jgi:hypothetical protein
MTVSSAHDTLLCVVARIASVYISCDRSSYIVLFARRLVSIIFLRLDRGDNVFQVEFVSCCALRIFVGVTAILCCLCLVRLITRKPLSEGIRVQLLD